MQEDSQETDTERRRGMMKIEGEAVKGICEETDAEGRKGRMKFDGEGLKGKTDAGQQKGEDDKSSLVWGCGQKGDSLLFEFLVWAAASVQNVN